MQQRSNSFRSTVLRYIAVTFFTVAMALSHPAALYAVGFEVIHNFTAGIEGSYPAASLVQGSDGNYYGTTQGDTTTDHGTVFKITPSGDMITLHSFNGNDGSFPNGLVQGSDGNFYGTTYSGGTAGAGTVFTITPGGTLTTLHSFIRPEGTNPSCALIQGSDGNFYGTTNGDMNPLAGMVFMISPGGALTILHSFNGNDGCFPNGLVQGSDGNFYGTTFEGGTTYIVNSAIGYGTLFKITPSGVLTTLHSFNGVDGKQPYAALVQGSDGNFYGTTLEGGTTFVDSAIGYGTVFKITPSGTLTSLHSFTGQDGWNPYACLIQGSDGNFYGTTAGGSNPLVSNVFMISPGGALTILHSFTGSDGLAPVGGLIQSSDGNFYGTTFQGGTTYNVDSSLGYGTVFKIIPDFVAPAAPTGLTATPGDGEAMLSWAASTGATSYNVKRATISGGPFAAVSSPTITNYTNTGLTNGTTYYFVISSVSSAGESGNSAQVSAVPDGFISGTPNLTLQNATTNQVAAWFMNGATVTGTQNVSLTPGPGWKVVGEADFNGDGKPDLVLQNASLNKAAVWYLNGTTVVTGQYVSMAIPSGWTIAAVGDFNGDGKPDLALQNTATSRVAFWYMNGATVTGGAYISVTPAAGWRVVGTGDFNADGKTDLVLQNATSNKVALWYLNGATLISGAYTSSTPPAGYAVVGTGDYNGDGKPDLVLQSAASNQVAFWYINGATVASGAYASATPPSSWQVVGSR